MTSAALGILCIALISRAAFGTEGPPSKRLAVISMPAGNDAHAEAARKLLPSKIGGYSVVTAKPSQAATSSEDTEPDQAPDGGVDSDNSIAEQAREAALAFDLVTAAELWRRAADSALKTEAPLLAPKRTASLLLEAAAAAVAAGETDLALVYFRKSIAVDSSITPGPEISPNAKSIFEQAVLEGPLVLDAPRESVLESVCDTLHVDGVVWASVGVENGEWIVQFKRFITGEAMGEVETRRYTSPLTNAQIADERSRFRRIVVGPSASKPTTPTAGTGENADPNRKPWYKKWWFYTAVGAVLIAGGAIGVGVWAASQPETVDATLHY